MEIRSKVASVYRNIWHAVGEIFHIDEEDFHPDVHEKVKADPPPPAPKAAAQKAPAPKSAAALDPSPPTPPAAPSSGPSSEPAPAGPPVVTNKEPSP